MSKYNPLISQRRPEFASFSDADIQNQYAKAFVWGFIRSRGKNAT